MSLTRDQITERCDGAGIPPLYRTKTLLDCGTHGKKLRGLFLGDCEYRQMMRDGQGLFMFGGADDRTLAFAVFAKTAALYGDAIILLSLRELVTALQYGGDEVERYRRVACIALTGFQQRGVECPYTFAERSFVENFLTERAEHRRRHHFSASEPVMQCGWWSEDLRAFLDPTVQEYSFGRKGGK